MEVKQSSEEKFEKGTYYIGDPCYIFEYNENWQTLLKETDYFNISYFEIDGYKCFVSGTMYGDGIYKDNRGNRYGVDSGTIGIIPIELVKKNIESIVVDMEIAQIVEMKEDFYPSYDEDATFYFGNIQIPTGG